MLMACTSTSGATQREYENIENVTTKVHHPSPHARVHQTEHNQSQTPDPHISDVHAQTTKKFRRAIARVHPVRYRFLIL